MNLAGLRAIRRDPLYRWEVRRYWTRRRSLGFAALTTAWCLLLFVLFSGAIPWSGSGGWLGALSALILQGAALHEGCRLPFYLMAAMGGALLLAPERASIQLEQFILTPMDPRRFAMARALGRLRGLATGWLLVGAILWGSFLAAIAAGVVPSGEADASSFSSDAGEQGAGWWPHMALVGMTAAGWVDLGLMTLLNFMIGLSFSASSRSVTGTVFKTCLVCFLLMPIIVNLPGAILMLLVTFGMARALCSPVGQGLGTIAGILLILYPAMCAGLRLSLGLLGLVFFRRRAMAATERLFHDPEKEGGGSISLRRAIRPRPATGRRRPVVRKER